MRTWTPTSPAPADGRTPAALAGMIDQLGKPRFEHALLEHLVPLVPAASCSIYRTGRGCEPRLFMSASRGVPDTTRDCWRAYLSGPYLRDRTFASGEPAADETLLCHISAGEVPPEHRARVYEAHGVAERVSVVRSHVNGSLFAVNFYRHRHQRPFSDAQLADFGAMAPALLSLTRRHVELALPDAGVPDGRAALLQASAELTPRELDVCLRILQGMTQEGIALDLGVGVPTVKTYRNRAFERLGIHFRNELFALVLKHRTIN